MQVYGADVASFPVDHDGTALAKYRRVKLTTTGTKLELSGATDVRLGFTSETVLADTTNTPKVPVVPRTAPVVKMVAAGAIGKGAAVYGAASGKVQSTAGSNEKIGQALTAAAADGDIILVAQTVHDDVPAVS
mgnify:CR=1 FL=1